MGFWAKQSKDAQSASGTLTPQETINETSSHTDNTDVDLVDERSQTDQPPKGDGSSSSPSAARVTPAQDRIRKEIAEITEELVSYACIREKAGLSVEYKKRVESLEEKKAKCEKDLKRKVIEQRSQQKVRNKKSKVLEKLRQDHPEAAESISKLQVRLALEEDHLSRMKCPDCTTKFYHSHSRISSGRKEKKQGL